MPAALPVLATFIEMVYWLPFLEDTGVAVILDMEKAAMEDDAGVDEALLPLLPVFDEDDEVEPEDDEVELVVDEDVVVEGVVELEDAGAM